MFGKLMSELHKLNNRFRFHVVVKDAPYTRMFIDAILKHPSFITVHGSKNDKVVINEYENIYMKDIIALEITKPSEQAFKALYYPRQRGGSILLFTIPIGRQEFDNLDFLRRHQLIPSLTERLAIWEMARETHNADEPLLEMVLKKCSTWRGFELPQNPEEAARFIDWCEKTGIFKRMVDHVKPRQFAPHHDHELVPTGVEDFWEEVSKFVKKALTEPAQ